MNSLEDILGNLSDWKRVDFEDYDEVGSFPDDRLLIELANGYTYYFVRDNDHNDDA